MAFEHPERLTNIPVAWVPKLVISGLVVIVWLVAGAVTGRGGKVPLVTCVAACAVAMWWATGRLGKDLADGAVAGYFAILVVLVVHGLLRTGRKAPAATPGRRR